MWQDNLIELLQRLSGQDAPNFLDWLVYIITYMGDEMFFMLVGAAIFWCIDKRFGFKFITVYLFGSAVNEGFKALFKLPRPYDSPSGRIKSLFDKTGGYTFPSGHSHSIANISSQLMMKYGKGRRWLMICAPIATALVMFSRMYLGQHYLTDVLAGAALGFVTALGFSLLFDLLKDKEHFIGIVAAPILTILCIFITSKNFNTVGGAFSAVSIGYLIEKKYIRFDVRARWWVQLIKLAVGLGVAFGIKEGFKLFLPESIPFLHVYLRYFCIGAWAVCGAPAVFKYFPVLWGKITGRGGKDGGAEQDSEQKDEPAIESAQG